MQLLDEMVLPDDFQLPGEDVKGWLSAEEAVLLGELANGKTVLELGSFRGRSTICLAQSAKVVYAADWHRGDDGTGKAWSLPDFMVNLKQYGVEKKVVVLVGRFEQLQTILAESSCDMAFIDGAHDETSVITDLEVAIHCVRSGGIIAMHDWAMDGVHRAARKLLGWKDNTPPTGSIRWERLTK